VRRAVEFEYRRRGTLAYLAAWDVHHASLFHRVEAKTGIEPFGRLVEQVMTSEPYASARTVYWIVDNGSSHAGRASIERLEGSWQNLRVIHLPIHASWLNQIELYFSIVQRKALSPNSFDSLDELADRLLHLRRNGPKSRGPLAAQGCCQRALTIFHPSRVRTRCRYST
jgi:DDE superfamily endonuclease